MIETVEMTCKVLDSTYVLLPKTLTSALPYFPDAAYSHTLVLFDERTAYHLTTSTAKGIVKAQDASSCCHKPESNEGPMDEPVIDTYCVSGSSSLLSLKTFAHVSRTSLTQCEAILGPILRPNTAYQVDLPVPAISLQSRVARSTERGLRLRPRPISSSEEP